MHVAVDTKTKQILAIEVTQEDVSDGNMLDRLVKGSSGKADLKRVVGDAGCDSKNNFRTLAEKGIDPLIKVRKNAALKTRGCMTRKIAVAEQLSNADWKREGGYGCRWMTESAFSCIKRVFGKHITSVK